MARRLPWFLLPLVLVGAVLIAPHGALPVGGQTIPLRPTATPEGGSFSAAAQPTPPPVPTVAAPATRPAQAPALPAATATRAPAASPSPSSSPPPAVAAQPAASPAPARGLRAEHLDLRPASLPAPPAGWRLGESAMRLSGAPPAGAAAEQFTVAVSTRDLAAAGGVVSRLALFSLDESGAWVREPSQSVDAAGRLTFRPTRAGVYAMLAAGLFPEHGDYAIPGGRFFRMPAAQGAEPAPLGGYGVMDGAGGAPTAFWTVYAAIGGEPVLGRPVSRRFLQDGRLVQAFERGVIAADARSNATARPGTTVEIPAAAREPESPPAALP